MSEAPKRSWWGRNWKWVVPVGCVGMIGAVVLLVGGLVFAMLGVLRSHPTGEMALAGAKAHPAVVAALGEPIEMGSVVTGNASSSNGSGDAELNIPISGPKGSGTIHMVAHKEGGKWEFELLEVELAGQEETVNLLDGPMPKPLE